MIRSRMVALAMVTCASLTGCGHSGGGCKTDQVRNAQGACVPGIAACSSQSDCPADSICGSSGSCVAGASRCHDGQCDSGQYCSAEDVCVEGCLANDDCELYQACQAGHCLATERESVQCSPWAAPAGAVPSCVDLPAGAQVGVDKQDDLVVLHDPQGLTLQVFRITTGESRAITVDHSFSDVISSVLALSSPRHGMTLADVEYGFSRSPPRLDPRQVCSSTLSSWWTLDIEGCALVAGDRHGYCHWDTPLSYPPGLAEWDFSPPWEATILLRLSGAQVGVSNLQDGTTPLLVNDAGVSMSGSNIVLDENALAWYEHFQVSPSYDPGKVAYWRFSDGVTSALALPAGCGLDALDASGSRVVWSDLRAPSSDCSQTALAAINREIYLWDVATGVVTQLTSGAVQHRNPSVFGNYVAWEDERNGNSDIYLWDLSSSAEHQVTGSAEEERDPTVTSSAVVWRTDSQVCWTALSDL